MDVLINELAKLSSLATRNLNLVEPVTPRETARPTPIMLANVACHVWTSIILLNNRSAFWANADLNTTFRVAPFFQHVLLLTLTGFTMKFLSALPTHFILAFRAGKYTTCLFGS